MKIAVGADHAGFALKQRLVAGLRTAGHEVHDLGTDSDASCDYPDYAVAAAREVVSGAADRAVLVCYTGTGMAMAANKVPGIRAAAAASEEAVRLTRSHNDANVLAIGAHFTSPSQADALVATFLNTEFDGGVRHVRRLTKMAAAENIAVEEQTTRS
jgi:ribose 5-phosphate isomerase B